MQARDRQQRRSRAVSGLRQWPPKETRNTPKGERCDSAREQSERRDRMLVIGDADGLPPSHAVEFFALLGGGQQDASWDRSGTTHHRLESTLGEELRVVRFEIAAPAKPIKRLEAGAGEATFPESCVITPCRWVRFR